MLSALAIFVGGFTREAAEAVADADLGVLAALAERSLIQRLPDAQGGSRYQVHELVRHYALRQLEDDRPIRARHFAYFLELVESLETSWNTPARAAVVQSHPRRSGQHQRRHDVGIGPGRRRGSVAHGGRARQVLDLLCPPARRPPGVAGSRA